jgi:hypothetical protein
VTEDEEASFADEVQQPELKFPGAYRSITIEITVRSGWGGSKSSLGILRAELVASQRRSTGCSHRKEEDLTCHVNGDLPMFSGLKTRRERS